MQFLIVTQYNNNKNSNSFKNVLNYFICNTNCILFAKMKLYNPITEVLKDKDYAHRYVSGDNKMCSYFYQMQNEA